MAYIARVDDFDCANGSSWNIAKTVVGDKYIYEYMAKNGCYIGGEQSDHIIFSKYAGTSTGILTSLKMKCLMWISIVLLPDV